MEAYEVVFAAEVRQSLEEIFSDTVPVYGFDHALNYVEAIERRCAALNSLPTRYSYDDHTKDPLTYRSFSYKAHKIFFVVNEETRTVVITAIVHGKSLYSEQL